MTLPLPRDTIIAVFGAGTMGAGIAQLAAACGHRVQLHDSRFGAADAAKKAIGDVLAKQVAKGKLAAADAEATVARISTVVTLPDACVAAMVIEAIVEDLAVKRELFAKLENVIAPECILASNTSSYSITALASGMKHPGRVVGMHFFNPVPLMPLVEVIAGVATDPAIAQTVFATAAAWGKTPVTAASTPGFIVNRCARPFYSEAFRLLAERAAAPQTIDAVMREAGGFRMGPFELMDLVGHDVNYAVTTSVWEATYYDPRYAPSQLQRERVAAGFLGRKSGRGYYDYSPGAAVPAPATELPAAKPAKVTVHGDAGVVAALVARMEGAGVVIERANADLRFAGCALHVAGAGDGVWLLLSDGRTATSRAAAAGVRDLVVFDLSLDYAGATRLAVAPADRCSDAAFAIATGALQSAGVAVSRFDDVAGLAVLRTVAMLANEAADLVLHGVATPAAIDLAMQRGVSYPRGPLAWADALGAAFVRDVLAHLAAHYADGRHRVSPLIARRALTGGKLHG
jgi:3-hydroxybutyryl-CoA dehydrogenase